MKAVPAGTMIDVETVSKEDLRRMFHYEMISEEVQERIRGKSYGEDCPVSYEELRYVRVLHKGFDQKTYIGELIVNRSIVQDIIEIFWELYEMEYPIERMLLIDEYDADDNRSMEDNNTSAFNHRNIFGTSRISNHSFGIAVDINPKYNPYITTVMGEERILPENAAEYADRNRENLYYIKKGDACYHAFTRRGFTWGGEWTNSKDYQHFQGNID